MLPVYSLTRIISTTQYGGNVHSSEREESRNLATAWWPTAYVSTLFEVLAAVRDGHDTNERLIQWFMRSFDVVKEAETALGYVGVPRTMGLTEMQGGKIRLTTAGQKLLDSRDLNYLYEVFAANSSQSTKSWSILRQLGLLKPRRTFLGFFKKT